MTRGSGSALLCGLAFAMPLRAQTARVTGTIFEGGVHATMTAVVEGRTAAVAGGRLAIRSTGTTRLVFSAGAGVSEDSLTARGEIAAEYLLSPRSLTQGFYFGGGLGGVVGAGHGGFLLVYAGIEGRPGGTSGWAFEAGLGGGFRFRFAWHWRAFPPGWRRN